MSHLDAFGRQEHNRGRGSVAEDEAVAWLRRQGYEIVERNVRNRGGELDVVARDGETLCFIEIKARSSDLYGPAVAAVGAAKQRRLAKAARVYLLLQGWTDVSCRFDVLGMDAADGGWRHTLIKNAFEIS
jgi:putative endonuclease